MLLKLKQISVLLNCSLSNAYQLVASGELPVHQIGLKKGLRVSEHDLTEYLAKVRRDVGLNKARSKPAAKLDLKHLDLS